MPCSYSREPTRCSIGTGITLIQSAKRPLQFIYWHHCPHGKPSQALAIKGVKFSEKAGKFARVATTATKVATKALPAVGAGLDFATGLAEGEDVQRAATGAVGSTLGSIVGGIGVGAAAGSIFPGIGTFAGAVVGLGGAIIGGLTGGFAADRVDEKIRGK